MPGATCPARGPFHSNERAQPGSLLRLHGRLRDGRWGHRSTMAVLRAPAGERGAALQRAAGGTARHPRALGLPLSRGAHERVLPARAPGGRHALLRALRRLGRAPLLLSHGLPLLEQAASRHGAQGARLPEESRVANRPRLLPVGHDRRPHLRRTEPLPPGGEPAARRRRGLSLVQLRVPGVSRYQRRAEDDPHERGRVLDAGVGVGVLFRPAMARLVRPRVESVSRRGSPPRRVGGFHGTGPRRRAGADLLDGFLSRHADRASHGQPVRAVAPEPAVGRDDPRGRAHGRGAAAAEEPRVDSAPRHGIRHHRHRGGRLRPAATARARAPGTRELQHVHPARLGAVRREPSLEPIPRSRWHGARRVLGVDSPVEHPFLPGARVRAVQAPPATRKPEPLPQDG
jgi:hypothetical protein